MRFKLPLVDNFFWRSVSEPEKAIEPSLIKPIFPFLGLISFSASCKSFVENKTVP